MSSLRRQIRGWAVSSSTASPVRQGQAGLAAVRVARASLILGALGVTSALFPLFRLLEAWRVTPQAASHRISIFGQALSYPTANAAAIVTVALAAVGLVVTLRAIGGAIRELAAARRLGRALTQLDPRQLRGAFVIDDLRPEAFCAGLIRPRVYISSGALMLLDESGLNAVLAHERHHASRRDPLRLATGRILARAFFFLPALAELTKRQQALAELSADESAVAAAPLNRFGLASAILSFSDASAGTVEDARVDYLLGESPNWRFPLALCLGAAAWMGLLIAVAVLAGRVAHGSATLAPPFLSRQPCVLVLAAIPSTLGLLALALSRRTQSPDTPVPSTTP